MRRGDGTVSAPDQGERAAVPGAVEECSPPEPPAEEQPADLARLTGKPRAWFDRALVLHCVGRPDFAAELLRRALLLEPTFGCLREALGRAQFDAGEFYAARTTFSAMTAIDPSDHFALFGLALAERRLGDTIGAVKHLDRAVALAPDDVRYAIAREHTRVEAGQRVRDSTGGRQRRGARS
jgi:tetratricopeptide (TPR) repeat protein